MVTRLLPATELTIPAEPEFTFGRLRQMRTSDGVAYALPLKVAGTVIGEVENQGDGGGTWFRPHVPGAITTWNAYVAACREMNPDRYDDAAGNEQVADDLVDEADLRARLGRTAKQAVVFRKTEGWGDSGTLSDLRDPYAYASIKGVALDDVRARVRTDGYTHYWTGSEWVRLASPTTEETPMPTDVLTDPKAEKLAKKAEAERQRQERIKAASRRLAQLPKDVQTRVQGQAARAEKDAREAGDRTASVVFLEQALDANALIASQVAAEQPERPVKAVPRPRGPREKSKPKETPDQLAPEKKAKAVKRPAAGPTAVEAKVTVTVPATHKTCTRCHEEKEIAEFLPKSGQGKPRPTCRPCYNEAWREFDKARKAKKAEDAAAAKTA